MTLREINVENKKLSQLSSGINPEIMQTGITLAGYHIEAGARKFADYTKAMTEDLGDGIRPYLKSFYVAVRNWPGFDPQGMDNDESIERFLEQEKERGRSYPREQRHTQL